MQFSSYGQFGIRGHKNATNVIMYSLTSTVVISSPVDFCETCSLLLWTTLGLVEFAERPLQFLADAKKSQSRCRALSQRCLRHPSHQLMNAIPHRYRTNFASSTTTADSWGTTHSRPAEITLFITLFWVFLASFVLLGACASGKLRCDRNHLPRNLKVTSTSPHNRISSNQAHSIRLSFRKGGDMPFYAQLKRALLGKAWEVCFR